MDEGGWGGVDVGSVSEADRRAQGSVSCVLFLLDPGSFESAGCMHAQCQGSDTLIG